MSKSTIQKIGYLAILICVPLIAFVPYIPFGNLGFSADDVLFLLVIAVGIIAYLILRFREKPPLNLPLMKGEETGIIAPFILLITASVFSSLYNMENFGDLVSMLAKGPFRFLLTLIFFLTVFYFLDSNDKIKTLLYALLAASAVESIFGIGAFLLSWQGPFNLGIATSRSYSVLDSIISGRVNGTFGSTLENFTGSNLLASYLITLIPISVSFIMIFKKGWQKFLAGLTLLLQSVCLVLTYTRSSIVYLLLSLTFFAWILEKKKTVLIVLAAASLLFALAVPGLKERFVDDPSNDRLDIWKSATLVALDHPVWGVGPGKYLDALSGNIIKYEVFTFDTEVLTPHNFFLYSWAIVGIFGLIAIIWLACRIGKDLWDKFKGASDGNSKIILAGILASSLGFLVQNFTNNFLFVPTVATYFWVLYVIGMKINC